jgi:hypothetical protein
MCNIIQVGAQICAARTAPPDANASASTPVEFGWRRAQLQSVKSNFTSCEHWSDAITHNLVQSEIEGGVDLRQVPPETVLQVRTLNHEYTIVNKGSGQALISGHPQFCPKPVLVRIKGSTWGGAMLKESFIGRGMRLEFQPEAQSPITTSPILEIEELAA